ncbi:unnamed protein product, partial [Discosporangium mesarthrocarpum]
NPKGRKASGGLRCGYEDPGFLRNAQKLWGEGRGRRDTAETPSFWKEKAAPKEDEDPAKSGGRTKPQLQPARTLSHPSFPGAPHSSH